MSNTTDTPRRVNRQIPIARPSTGDEELALVEEVVRSGWLTQGSKVDAFEQGFAARHGVDHAVAVTSCTTGLHLTLKALGIGHGDEVIVPSFTWVSTANVVLYCDAVPVFVDVDRKTFNIDVAKVASALTPKTRAIIPVHLFGLCADVDGLRSVIPENVHILEDAACATGATCNGRPAGSLGDAGVFSFHPRKSLTTGEGGMITTHSAELADKLRQLRDHGATMSDAQRHHGPQPYLLPEFDMLGFNYRMTDLQGAIGLAQLEKFDRFLTEREQGARFYQERLGGIDWLALPDAPSGWRHGWQAYVTYVHPERAPRPRNEIMAYLLDEGVSTRPGTHAVHELAYYRERFGIEPGDFPVARDCAANTMAIPLHNTMDEDDLEQVADALLRLS